jgi:hypothetical protein
VCVSSDLECKKPDAGTATCVCGHFGELCCLGTSCYDQDAGCFDKGEGLRCF